MIRIFLVEDAPMLRARLEAMIGAIPGAAVAGHASGAQAAISAILATPPDGVVLDLHLDEGNGFDVLRALREAAPQVQTFVLTNFPTEPYRRKAHSLGARGFFDKSHDLDALREALRNIPNACAA